MSGCAYKEVCSISAGIVVGILRHFVFCHIIEALGNAITAPRSIHCSILIEEHLIARAITPHIFGIENYKGISLGHIYGLEVDISLSFRAMGFNATTGFHRLDITWLFSLTWLRNCSTFRLIGHGLNLCFCLSLFNSHRELHIACSLLFGRHGSGYISSHHLFLNGNIGHSTARPCHFLGRGGAAKEGTGDRGDQ